MLKKFRADLHIHTCLSPCADLEMTPYAIIRNAFEKEIDIIAITDHNSAENIVAAKKAAEKTEITVFAGMEITSSEEAHIIALFSDVQSVIKLQDIVYENLLPGINDEKLFGEQIVVNEKDEVLDFNKRLLIGATTLSAHEVLQIIHSLGGLAIASHIDREAFSIVSQLGFIPDDLRFDALEISPNTEKAAAELQFDMYRQFTWVTSSDAHDIRDIGKRTTGFTMKQPTIEEMRQALKNTDGRKSEWE
ncbi:MAG: PHP domain-containing protein [Nitrospiraceae bacterium]|nr:MAG: PHP domain-containing protein [Nitrospiraceae bacterium]